MSAVAAWREKLGVQIESCSYWEAYSKENAGPYMTSGFAMIPGHSAEFETSFALAAFPERIHRVGVDYSKVKLNLKSPKDVEDDRTYYQDSLLATAEKGEALIGMAVNWVAEKVRHMIE
jgi:creatinine amidohydrolase/Fe(II)-dependent formamide hydrolase-like protein